MYWNGYTHVCSTHCWLLPGNLGYTLWHLLFPTTTNKAVEGETKMPITNSGGHLFTYLLVTIYQHVSQQQACSSGRMAVPPVFCVLWDATNEDIFWTRWLLLSMASISSSKQPDGWGHCQHTCDTSRLEALQSTSVVTCIYPSYSIFCLYFSCYLAKEPRQSKIALLKVPLVRLAMYGGWDDYL